MKNLLDYFASETLSDVTPAGYDLPCQDGKREFERRVAGLLEREPPDDSIQAFDFGMFYPVSQTGARLCFYLSGSGDFNSDERFSDWACSPEYFPKGRYAFSSASSLLDAVPSAGDSLTLGFLGLMLRNGMHPLPPNLTLGKRNRRDLAIGYDAGDLYLLPAIER